LVRDVPGIEVFPAGEEEGIGGRTDDLSGLGVVASLLLGGSPKTTLISRRGGATGTVPGVEFGEEEERGSGAVVEEDFTAINFVIGLDDTIHRRAAVPPQRIMYRDGDGPQGQLAAYRALRSALLPWGGPLPRTGAEAVADELPFLEDMPPDLGLPETPPPTPSGLLLPLGLALLAGARRADREREKSRLDLEMWER
jgi:hypothetical protein